MARWWAYTGGAFADAIVVVTWVSQRCIHCPGTKQAKEAVDRRLADELTDFNLLVGHLDTLIDNLAKVTAGEKLR